MDMENKTNNVMMRKSDGLLSTEFHLIIYTKGKSQTSPYTLSLVEVQMS